MKDSNHYVEKKKFFSTLLTIYGRKPVLEALNTQEVKTFRLHLADSNKPAAILDEIIEKAQSAGTEILYHSRESLSRISKNKKQDQGVALDVKPKGFQDIEEFLSSTPKQYELIALDNITNPQNLGMMIRSVCASPLTALLLPQKGCAKLDALVIKASAGTLFKAKIIRCADLGESLKQLSGAGGQIIGLDLNSTHSFKALDASDKKIFVLGNETEGLQPTIKALCHSRVKIPMENNVESLNVAVTASIIAFRNTI